MGYEANDDALIVQRADGEVEFLGPERWRTIVFTTPKKKFWDLISAVSGVGEIDPNKLSKPINRTKKTAYGLRSQALRLLNVAAGYDQHETETPRLFCSYLDALEVNFILRLLKSLIPQLHRAPALMLIKL
ncbi:hypothetical protein [Shimia abyssi]|uniref:Uncharacterized protein n=1 Tax=Shimia abyssi TaxID=1662395 RepID=A0A2P8F6X0_9RHOB|nr:hypothetical protein [Shimia abyssi]PSL17463.1 hypothetical protein CLV88_11726 [Shimia abyssi]